MVRVGIQERPSQHIVKYRFLMACWKGLRKLSGSVIKKYISYSVISTSNTHRIGTLSPVAPPDQVATASYHQYHPHNSLAPQLGDPPLSRGLMMDYWFPWAQANVPSYMPQPLSSSSPVAAINGSEHLLSEPIFLGIQPTGAAVTPTQASQAAEGNTPIARNIVSQLDRDHASSRALATDIDNTTTTRIYTCDVADCSKQFGKRYQLKYDSSLS
jgi:hypothetical protein